MKLEEFRAALESDAMKRAETQEETIRQQNALIQELKAALDEKETRCQQLMNRCHAQTRGLLCFFCGMKGVCRAHS